MAKTSFCYNLLPCTPGKTVRVKVAGDRTKKMPKGNPNAGLNGIETRFASDRNDPLVARLQVRVSESLKTELKAIPDWQEFVRETLEKAIAERQRRSLTASQSNET